jgi:hypothetical protein
MGRRLEALLLLATIQVLAGQCTSDQRTVGVTAAPPLAYPSDEPASNVAGTSSGRRLQQAMTTEGETLLVRSLSPMTFFGTPACHPRTCKLLQRSCTYTTDKKGPIINVIRVYGTACNTLRTIVLCGSNTNRSPVEVCRIFSCMYGHCFPPTVTDGSVDSTRLAVAGRANTNGHIQIGTGGTPRAFALMATLQPKIADHTAASYGTSVTRVSIHLTYEWNYRQRPSRPQSPCMSAAGTPHTTRLNFKYMQVPAAYSTAPPTCRNTHS